MGGWVRWMAGRQAGRQAGGRGVGKRGGGRVPRKKDEGGGGGWSGRGEGDMSIVSGN